MPFYEISPASSSKATVLDTILEYLNDSDTTVNVANDLIVGDSFTCLGSMHITGSITTDGGGHTSADDVSPTASRVWLETGSQTITGAKSFTDALRVNTTAIIGSQVRGAVGDDSTLALTSSITDPTDRAPSISFQNSESDFTLIEQLGNLNFYGRDGTSAMKKGAEIRVSSGATWSNDAHRAPTRMDFYCEDHTALRLIPTADGLNESPNAGPLLSIIGGTSVNSETGNDSIILAAKSVHITQHDASAGNSYGLYLGATKVYATGDELNMLANKSEDNFITDGFQTINGFKNLTGVVAFGNMGTQNYLEMGSTYIELHSGGDNAHDAKITWSGFETAVDNGGDLGLQAATVNIFYHDEATKGLKLANTLVTSSAAELNLLDGMSANNLVTAAAQTWTGDKTFSGAVSVGGKITVGDNAFELQRVGTTSTINSVYDDIMIVKTGVDRLEINDTETILSHVVRISEHNGTTKGLMLGTELVTATAGQINLLTGLSNLLDGNLHNLDDLDDSATRQALTTGVQTISGAKTFSSAVTIPRAIRGNLLRIESGNYYKADMLNWPNYIFMNVIPPTPIRIYLPGNAPELDGVHFTFRAVTTDNAYIQNDTGATVDGNSTNYSMGISTTGKIITYVYEYAADEWYEVYKNWF